MKIGIISDTHNKIELIRKAIEVFKREKVEMIIHAGDMDMAKALEEFSDIGVAIKMAIGNIDEEPERYLEKAKSLRLDFFMNSFVDFEIDNCRFYVFHGKVFGRLEDVLEVLIKSGKYKAIIYGHTHIPRKEIINGVLILNPGSLEPLVAGVKPSVAVYETSSNNADFFEL